MPALLQGQRGLANFFIVFGLDVDAKGSNAASYEYAQGGIVEGRAVTQANKEKVAVKHFGATDPFLLPMRSVLNLLPCTLHQQLRIFGKFFGDLCERVLKPLGVLDETKADLRVPTGLGGPGVQIKDVERGGSVRQTFSGKDVGALAANLPTLFGHLQGDLQTCFTALGDALNDAFAWSIDSTVLPEQYEHHAIDLYVLSVMYAVLMGDSVTPTMHGLVQHNWVYLAVLGELIEKEPSLKGLTLYHLGQWAFERVRCRMPCTHTCTHACMHARMHARTHARACRCCCCCV